MECRVSIKWTTTAKGSLKSLPQKVRRGLLTKIDGLYECDPRSAYKALTGPLQGCYRIPYGRYRAIYKVDETEELANGDTILHLKVLFIATGIRKEHDKKDIYRVAEKLIKLVCPDDEIELKEANEADEEPE